MPEKYLYYGNLGVTEKQFQIEKFVGLALYPKNDREIKHNALDTLPFDNESISKIQSQDVFEHLPYKSIPKIFDDIYRVMRTGGVFRLSVPDYRSPLLKRRSIYDYRGNVLGDLLMGAKVSYDYTEAQKTGFNPEHPIKVEFSGDGDAHIWFPRYESILDLIIHSKIRHCREIVFYQYYLSDYTYVCDSVPENEMYVMRCAPNDERSNGKPISIVVDFVK
jgi:SAM-dependent methyltransferase